MDFVKTIENATEFDELIAGHSGAGRKIVVELEKGHTFVRGGLLTFTESMSVAPTGVGEVADLIFCGDGYSKKAVDLTDATANAKGIAYEDGVFHREKIVVAEGDTVEAHEAELRQKNILFTKLAE